MGKVEPFEVPMEAGLRALLVRSRVTSRSLVVQSLCSCCAVLIYRSLRGKGRGSRQYVGQDRQAATKWMPRGRWPRVTRDGGLVA